METNASRTLLKSPPELWELADDPNRLESWMGSLVGGARPPGIEITARRPGQVLAWRGAEGAGEQALIAIELAEKGFGTSVSITAWQAQADPAKALAVLESLLDELGSPERRPFERG